MSATTRPEKASRRTSFAHLQPSLPTSDRERMDVGCLTEQSRPFQEVLANRVIGQEEAQEKLTCVFSRVTSELRDPTRPALNLLLLGPTGVGKTETAKAFAETLFGSEHALTRVNCEEYPHGHELAKLLGAPPGYVGHQIEPLLSQRRIDKYHRQALIEGTGLVGARNVSASSDPETGSELSVILFDEIEKAHPTLWNAMLGILEGGTLTLGDNSTTSFTQSIIVMTSNVGSQELGSLLEKKPMGFRSIPGNRQADDFRKTILTAAREKFPMEFLNRFDEILVYASLERRHLEAIFDKFLVEIHVRAMRMAGVPLLIKVSTEARDLILERGTDLAFGARPLRRAVEVALVDPLSRLIGSNRVSAGDVIDVERTGDDLAFYRRATAEPTLVV